MVEGGGFEPPKLSRQIYSLIPLTTREPLPEELPRSGSLALLYKRGILWETGFLCNRFAQILLGQLAVYGYCSPNAGCISFKKWAQGWRKPLRAELNSSRPAPDLALYSNCIQADSGG